MEKHISFYGSSSQMSELISSVLNSLETPSDLSLQCVSLLFFTISHLSSPDYQNLTPLCLNRQCSLTADQCASPQVSNTGEAGWPTSFDNITIIIIFSLIVVDLLSDLTSLQLVFIFVGNHSNIFQQ